MDADDGLLEEMLVFLMGFTLLYFSSLIYNVMSRKRSQAFILT